MNPESVNDKERGAQPLSPSAAPSSPFLKLTPAKQALLERGLKERHEILRTIYPTHEGAPVQHIVPPQPVELAAHDLSGLPDSERKAGAENILDSAMRHPFVPDRDLLLRATCVQVDSTEALLLLNSHHIASDGWSKGILFRELAALYEGNAAALRPLLIQCADFALWQRAALWGDSAEELLSYWKTRLAGALELLEFPTDFLRPRASLIGRPHLRNSAELPDGRSAQAVSERKQRRSTGPPLRFLIPTDHTVFASLLKRERQAKFQYSYFKLR
jgi:hypothetical protein